MMAFFSQKLSIYSKLTAICISFSIPFFVLLWLLVANIKNQVQFSIQETYLRNSKN